MYCFGRGPEFYFQQPQTFPKGGQSLWSLCEPTLVCAPIHVHVHTHTQLNLKSENKCLQRIIFQI